MLCQKEPDLSDVVKCKPARSSSLRNVLFEGQLIIKDYTKILCSFMVWMVGRGQGIFKISNINSILLYYILKYVYSKIKSNHFYCHITTAQVPWWVKFLRACSRQCKKNKNKYTTIYIWTVHIYRLYRRQCANYTYIYSVHTVYYKDILSYQYTLYTICTRLHYVHIYA